MLRRQLMLKYKLYVQDAGKETRRDENASGTFVDYLESQLQNQGWEASTPNSVFEAVESERHLLQNQESLLSHEAQRREYQHQQEVARH